MTIDFKSTFQKEPQESAKTSHLHKANVELLCGVAPGKIAPNVYVVVLDDPCNDVRCRYAFRSLGGHELTGFFQRLVYVLRTPRVVWKVIVCYEIDLEWKRGCGQWLSTWILHASHAYLILF